MPKIPLCCTEYNWPTTGHGIHGLHVDVEESMAHTILLLVEGALFALGGGDNPIATSVVTDCESICLELGEREEIGNAIAN